MQIPVSVFYKYFLCDFKYPIYAAADLVAGQLIFISSSYY